MSYYGGDRSPYAIRDRAGAKFRSQRHAVTRKIGHNARVTVETGATDRQNGELAYRPTAVERVQSRRQEQLGRRVNYYEPMSRTQRRTSLSSTTHNSSPVYRQSAPPIESQSDDDDVDEEAAITINDSEHPEDLDFRIPKADK